MRELADHYRRDSRHLMLDCFICRRGGFHFEAQLFYDLAKVYAKFARFAENGVIIGG